MPTPHWPTCCRNKTDLHPSDTRRAWCELMAASAARGVAVQRIRVVSEPHSDYVRWLPGSSQTW
ncbi:DUF6879 family protein [Nocardia sp. GAS34]|uniref:DUF6879 family protein n=1 Tax=unclassified Nocardia TaxID=2637762 RepID=UPI003D1B4611